MSDSISPISIKPQTSAGIADFARKNTTMIALVAIPTAIIAGYLIYTNFFATRTVTPGNPGETTSTFKDLDDNISIEDLKKKLPNLKLEDVKEFIKSNPTSPKYTKAVAVSLALETDKTKQIQLVSIDKADEALAIYADLKDKAAAKELATSASTQAANDLKKDIFKSTQKYLETLNASEEYYKSPSVPYNSICKMLDETELGELFKTLKKFPDSHKDQQPLYYALETSIKLHFTEKSFGKSKMPDILKANKELAKSALTHLEKQANSRTGWEFAEFSAAYPEITFDELNKLISGQDSAYTLSSLTIALAFPKLDYPQKKALLKILHSTNQRWAEDVLFCIKDPNNSEKIGLYLATPGRKWSDLLSLSHGLTLEQMKDNIDTIKKEVKLDGLDDGIKDRYKDDNTQSSIEAYVLGLLVAPNSSARCEMLKGKYGTTLEYRKQALDKYCELMGAKTGNEPKQTLNSLKNELGRVDQELKDYATDKSNKYSSP